MRRIKRIKAGKVFPLVKEILDGGKRIKMTVTGRSMYPFLRDMKDSVELTGIDFEDIQPGDIVLVLNSSGQYVLHRVVVKEEDCFYILGDAQVSMEGPIMPDQVLAVVTKVWSRGLEIDCDSLLWRKAASFWMSLLPLRRFSARAYHYLHKII